VSKSRSTDHIHSSLLQSLQGRGFGLSFPHFIFFTVEFNGDFWYLQITKPDFSCLVSAVFIDSDISITEEFFLWWSSVITLLRIL